MDNENILLFIEITLF